MFSFFRTIHQLYAHKHAHALGGPFSAQIQQTSAREGYQQQDMSRELGVARNLSVIAWVELELWPAEVDSVRLRYST